MRVLHVIPRLAIQCGGPVTAVLGMTSALSKAGVEVRLITTDHWSEGRPDKIECDTKFYPCLFGPWQFSPKLNRALPDEVAWADVVNLHTLWSFPTAAAARMCRKMDVPYILRPCGMLDSWSRAQKSLKKHLYTALIERRIINGAASLWFTSEEERRGAQSFNYLCADTVIPLGLAPEAYKDLPPAGAFRRQHPELEKRRYVLFLGRVTPKKQTGLLLKAYARVCSEFPDVSLVIAGPDEGTYLRELKQLAKSSGVDDRVLFTGPLRGQNVQAALRDSEVFVLPSLHENFGVSVIEALACSVPVVLSNLVNLAADISRSEAGLAITPDEESLVQSLRALLSNPALARQMGQRGRQLALDCFTWEGIVPKLIELYEKAMSGKLKAGAESRLLRVSKQNQVGGL